MGNKSTVVEKSPDIRDKVLEMTIEELDLSVRSFNCLKRANINTVEDLISKDGGRDDEGAQPGPEVSGRSYQQTGHDGDCPWPAKTIDPRFGPAEPSIPKGVEPTCPVIASLASGPDQRKAMLRAMVTYLLEHGQIKTTLARAKEGWLLWQRR